MYTNYVCHCIVRTARNCLGRYTHRQVIKTLPGCHNNGELRHFLKDSPNNATRFDADKEFVRDFWKPEIAPHRLRCSLTSSQYHDDRRLIISWCSICSHCYMEKYYRHLVTLDNAIQSCAKFETVEVYHWKFSWLVLIHAILIVIIIFYCYFALTITIITNREECSTISLNIIAKVTIWNINIAAKYEATFWKFTLLDPEFVFA